MKYVVTLPELQQLIPETKSLEGITFKNMKDLLEKVIREIERTNYWEFVQYINANPSVFIVKEKEQPKVIYTERESYVEPEKPQTKKSKSSTTNKKTEVDTQHKTKEPLFEKVDTNFPW